MFRRRLYGLNVCSNLPLPLPRTRGDGIDLTIRWQGLASPLSFAPPSWVRIWDQDEYGRILRYIDRKGRYVAFHFDMAGSAISVCHHTPFDWQDFLSILLGPALSAALHLRNIPCLHGSAVLREGGAVLLAGNGGAGKSTMTAALVNSGLPLLCEESAALVFDSGGVFVQPGYPLLKLSPQSLQALGQSPGRLPYAFPFLRLTDERWLDVRLLPGGFHHVAAPLKAVYLLAGRSREIRRPRILTLAPAEACLHLRKHLYGREWLPTPPEEAMRLCASIAATALVRRVWLPEGLEQINAAAQAIIDDAMHAAA